MLWARTALIRVCQPDPSAFQAPDDRRSSRRLTATFGARDFGRRGINLAESQGSHKKLWGSTSTTTRTLPRGRSHWASQNRT